LFVYSFLFTDISNAILENNIYVRYCWNTKLLLFPVPPVSF
jgi:uncharacterized membrane protein